jgi:hypothetical protein
LRCIVIKFNENSRKVAEKKQKNKKRDCFCHDTIYAIKYHNEEERLKEVVNNIEKDPKWGVKLVGCNVQK